MKNVKSLELTTCMLQKFLFDNKDIDIHFYNVNNDNQSSMHNAYLIPYLQQK